MGPCDILALYNHLICILFKNETWWHLQVRCTTIWPLFWLVSWSVWWRWIRGSWIILLFSGAIMLSHVSVFLYSGKIKSVSDRVGHKLHRVHQRLLRHGETTAKLCFCHHFTEGPFKHVSETFAGRLMPLVSPQGHHHSKEFIVSQTPLSSTVADFWRMIWEHNTHTVVRLPDTHCQV